MSYIVLARKWRPQTFEDIAGQSHVTRTLQNAISAGRIAHAYLFAGVRGVGKTTAARVLAKALNCEKGPAPRPCNECAQCREITSGTSIDVLEIDAASNRGIDEIRQIIENVRYQPARCRFKIYIIDEVHQVTREAFNALLKTLEEPPPSVKFILATTEPHRLPETILSRCQRFDFRRIARRELVERLREIAASEGARITDGALVSLAREADGSMRDAQSLLEQVLACAAPAGAEAVFPVIDEESLQSALGIAERELLYRISGAVLQGNPRYCLELVAQTASEGRDLTRLSRDLVEHFRNLLVARLIMERGVRARTDDARLQSPPSNLLLELPDQEVSDLEGQARNLAPENLLEYFDVMAAGDEQVACSANPRFALEALLVRLAVLPKTVPIAQLIDRLERLESKIVPARRASAVEAEPARRPADAARAAAAAERPEGGSDRQRVWQDFIAFVGNEKKFLASHLAAGTALELSSGLLKIGVAERHHLAYLQDADNLAALRTLAGRFFSGEVAISLTAVTPETAPERSDSGEGIHSAKAEQRSNMVHEALRIFGGSVRTVRREN